MVRKTLFKLLREHWMDIAIIVIILKNDLSVSPILFAYLATPLVIRLVLAFIS